MKLNLTKGPAYCTLTFRTSHPSWSYINGYGVCFDCEGENYGVPGRMILRIELEGGSRKAGLASIPVGGMYDMRTLEMIEAGCCPPGLMNEMLDDGPG